MRLPEPTATDTIVATAAQLRQDQPHLGLEASLQAVLLARPDLERLYQQEQVRGVHQMDAVQLLDAIAKHAEAVLNDNPCVEIVKRATALRTLDPQLTEDQALVLVCKRDLALAERYRTRDPRRHPWPEVPPQTPEPNGDPLALINKRLGAGESLDEIARRDPPLLEAYRRAQLKGVYHPLTTALGTPPGGH